MCSSYEERSCCTASATSVPFAIAVELDAGWFKLLAGSETLSSKGHDVSPPSRPETTDVNQRERTSFRTRRSSDRETTQPAARTWRRKTVCWARGIRVRTLYLLVPDERSCRPFSRIRRVTAVVFWGTSNEEGRLSVRDSTEAALCGSDAGKPLASWEWAARLEGTVIFQRDATSIIGTSRSPE